MDSGVILHTSLLGGVESIGLEGNALSVPSCLVFALPTKIISGYFLCLFESPVLSFTLLHSTRLPFTLDLPYDRNSGVFSLLYFLNSLRKHLPGNLPVL